jgi:hypothetical protein
MSAAQVEAACDLIRADLGFPPLPPARRFTVAEAVMCRAMAAAVEAVMCKAMSAAEVTQMAEAARLAEATRMEEAVDRMPHTVRRERLSGRREPRR